VGLYNPLISLMSMMVLPLDVIVQHPSDLLAIIADRLGGNVFRTILCIDAVIILCGGVLTGIVGVSALLCRLASDGVLPSFLSRLNYRGSPYLAIIIFVGLSMSLFLTIFDPAQPKAMDNFGGVYAISFLTVLSAFGLATILLKLHRARLARRMIAHWWEIFFSIAAVLCGLFGNIILTPQVFTLFLCYLSGYLAVVIYMFSRVELMSFFVWMVSNRL
jgi:amino acid transporter